MHGMYVALAVGKEESNGFCMLFFKYILYGVLCADPYLFRAGDVILRNLADPVLLSWTCLGGTPFL